MDDGLQEDLEFNDKPLYGTPAGFEAREWQRQADFALGTKLNAHSEGQFRFLCYAGVGAGKTSFAAKAACLLLNKRTVERIVYVAPNRIIMRAVKKTFKSFGIHLVEWSNRKHKDGEGVNFVGAVITYQSLANDPFIHCRIARRRKTLVIFDEIHHLGDSLTWGQAARQAFEGESTYVLGLSGTPFRGDNAQIPFITYEDEGAKLKRFKADYSYPLGRAIADQKCRKPVAVFLDAEVEVKQSGEVTTYKLTESTPDEMANILLSAAVKPGSAARRNALEIALSHCRLHGLKLIIFLGGDSTSSVLATEDAQSHLPQELRELGLRDEEFLSVTSANKGAAEQLSKFGASNAWVLITVNMVSEGVDIPELSAALFLTNITATGTTMQRIGRVLRGDGTAPIFMFKDRRYVELMEEIESTIEKEILLKQKKERQGNSAGGMGNASKIEAYGIAAWEDGMTVNGKTYPQFQVNRAKELLKSKGLPETTDRLATALVLMGDDHAAA